jgi:hypothetical protein
MALCDGDGIDFVTVTGQILMAAHGHQGKAEPKQVLNRERGI